MEKRSMKKRKVPTDGIYIAIKNNIIRKRDIRYITMEKDEYELYTSILIELGTKDTRKVIVKYETEDETVKIYKALKREIMR